MNVLQHKWLTKYWPKAMVSLSLTATLLLSSCGGGSDGEQAPTAIEPADTLVARTELAPDSNGVIFLPEPPLADAGPDQLVAVNDSVVLKGSGSSNTNGKQLNYHWLLISKPADSQVKLTNANTIHASFVVDKPGDYQVQLIVSDEFYPSLPDIVVISTENIAPVANAGADQTVILETEVTVDGSGSNDADGDRLSYLWSLESIPTNSQAALSNNVAVTPSFTADQPGVYIAKLVVTDGQLNSQPDHVQVTSDNTRPTANAGPDQSVFIGDMATLDGTASSDVNGQLLTYRWALLSIPQGSAAKLSKPTTLSPQLTIDVAGIYQIQLIVNDGLDDSEADTVVLTTENSPPLADAGDDQSIFVADNFLLNGGNSTDIDGDVLFYRWSLLSMPQASQAVLSDAQSINPSVQADLPGDYIIQLIVNDGSTNSAPDTVTISTVNSRPTARAGDDQDTLIGEPVRFDGAQSTDPDGDILDYHWALIARPDNSTVVLNSPTQVITQLTPDKVGIYIAQLIVNDKALSSDPDTITINVSDPNAVNNPPIVASIAAQAVRIDQQLTLAVSASDPDGDNLNFGFSQRPLGMQIDDNGIVSWLPVEDGQYTVGIEVSDGRGGETSQTFTVGVSGGAAQTPVFNHIPDQTAVLGQTFTLYLLTTDPRDPNVFYSVEPMPLPPNMQLDAQSGTFTFTPTLDQVGNINLSFIISNGRFQQRQNVTINTPEPDGATRLSGSVLTANNAPLPNVRVEMGGVEAVTDANGAFFIDNIPTSGQVRLLVDGSNVDAALGAFATVPEMVNIIPGVDNKLTPAIFLIPLDVASADMVDPGQTSVVTSSRFTDGLSISAPVTMTVPPSSAINDATGGNFSGDVHISRVADPTLGPRPLPENFDFSVYIAIQPFGVSYPNPVPISFPNLENSPPGSRYDFFALNHESGEMEKIGEGLVSADGKTVDSIGGVVKSNSWHGIVPQENDNAPAKNPDVAEPIPDDEPCPAGGGAPDADAAPGTPDTGCPDAPDEPPKQNPNSCVACSINQETGNLSEWHNLPAYQSLQSKRRISLEYNSNLANPKPILPYDSAFGNQAPPPETMSMRINVNGIEFGDEYFSQVNVTRSDIRGQFKPTRLAVQFDANNLVTGLHPYDLKVNCHFPISRRQTTVSGQVIVQNERQSAIGAGWTIAGLQRVIEHQDGSVLLTTGTASSLVFRPVDGGGFSAPAAEFSTLTRSNDGTLLRQLKNGTIYRFNSDGLLVEVLDRNNNSTRYEYDSQQRLIEVVDPTELGFVLDYSSGKLTSITDPLARITTFEHDAEGNLVKIIEPNGDKRSFEYRKNKNLLIAQSDQRNNRKTYGYNFAERVNQATLPDNSRVTYDIGIVKGLVNPAEHQATQENPAPAPQLVEDIQHQVTDFNGNVTTFAVDKLNRPLNYADAVERSYQTVRDNDSNPTQTTRPNLSAIKRIFDDEGNVLERLETFNQAKRQYSYDNHSLMTKYTNPNGHERIINRDTRGNINTSVNHLGHTTTYSHDERGLITQLITPNQLQIDYQYNEQALVEKITETPPADSGLATRISQFKYDAAGQTTQVTTPDNITLDLSYDSKGRLIQLKDNSGQLSDYHYDGFDNLIKTESKNSDGTLALKAQRAFDNRNRLTDIRAPHSASEDSVTQFERDDNSNLTGIIDPNGNRSASQYDGEDRLTQGTHRLNGHTKYQYDTNNRLISLIAPNGVITTYTYDKLGRRLTEQSPDRGTQTYTYDKANNVTSVVDGRGIVKTLQYDELERVISKTYPNTHSGKTENVSYSYDDCAYGVGRLCGHNDESGNYSYVYDPFGNLTSSTRITNGISYITAYAYDEGNNLTQMIYPTGRVVTYGRDEIKRLTGISTKINGTNQTIVSNILYRADDQMTQCTFGNGLIDSRSYDLQGRLLGQTLNSIDARVYNYDKNGNILSRTTTPQNSAYQYDALDRILADKIGELPAIDYGYDLNHNRQSKVQSARQTQSLTYQQNTNRVLRRAATSDGSLPPNEQLDRRMVYNDANRLYQVTDFNELKAKYLYADNGLRSQKMVVNADGSRTTTLYHYDLMGNLIAETDETAAVIKEYLWSNGYSPAAQIDVSAGTDTLFYLHTDHLMTPRFATNASQQIVWRWEGEAFGNTADDISLASVNLRFPGQYFDRETGVYYNWHRYYNPQVGRYMTSDPIGLAGGMNTYGYVEGNPLRYIDPQGRKKFTTTYSVSFMKKNKGFKLGFSGGADTAGKTCIQVKACPRIGYGLAAGASRKEGVAEGVFCEGFSADAGLFAVVGPVSITGPLPDKETLKSDIDSTSIGRGMGLAIGVQGCFNYTYCF